MDIYSKFGFIKEELYRSAYITAYDSIDELKLWNWIKKDHKSFSMPDCVVCKDYYKNDYEYLKNLHKCNHDNFKNYKILEDKIEEKFPYHSAGSYGCTLRVMQKIGRMGYFNYKWNFIKKNENIKIFFDKKYGYYKMKYQELKETNKKNYLKVLFLVFKINQVFSDPKYNYCKKRIKYEYNCLFFKDLYL